MPEDPKQLIAVIIGVILVLLFLGILFLSMLIYIKTKRKQMHQEKQTMMLQYETQLLETKIEIQEQTFNYISGELHDHVGQTLSLAKVQLSVLEASGTFNHPLVQEAKNSITESLDVLRTLAHTLDGDRIKSFNLGASVEEEVHRLNRTGLYAVALQADGDLSSVPDDHRLLLFRVIQECLQNVLKHADATSINISLQKTDAHLKIVIEDNGKGFETDPSAVLQNGSGLTGIKRRIQVMGGQVDVASRPDSGTRVTININYA